MGVKKKILIVEDDCIVRSSLERLLGEGDFKIEVAESGEEGLEKYNHLRYDLILTDVKLPGIDGLDMVTKMRQQNDALPFIVLSAYGEGDDILRAMKLGALDYCMKPFDAKQLLDLTKKSTIDSISAIAEDNHQRKETMVAAEATMETHSSAENNLLQGSHIELERLTRLVAPYVSLGKQGTGITHNLNGPSTGMMGHLELMKIKHPEMSEDVDIIMGLAKKLRDSIADLQSKFENETIREEQLISINHLLQSELAYLQTDLFYKHYIQREVDLDKTIPNIKGIYADFSLAFEEIILNAIDAQRDQKDGKVTVRTYQRENAICVEIDDSGPGFSEEGLSNAFKPFWPEVRTYDDGRIRIGLGLYSSQKWLESYGVTISLENLQPKGARVRVLIPSKKA
jgi:DNA-binding response OmpR family regulator